MVLNNIKVGDPARVLGVDGDFGQKTKAATLIFQKQAFPTAPKEWDAIVGAKTWTKGFESIK
jgi:peptidoglycan hydrolase-like protein with peptidoglycan-binding domain